VQRVPTYFAGCWHHDIEDDPVLLYEGLDDQRQCLDTAI